MEQLITDQRIAATSEKFTVYIQEMDNLVQFDIWARTNKKAEEMATAFENMMIIHGLVWKQAGINKVYFYRRFMDDKLDNIGTGVQRRRLHYYVRTQKQFLVPKIQIEEITARITAIINTEEEANQFFMGELNP
jgi:hypothetical protein